MKRPPLPRVPRWARLDDPSRRRTRVGAFAVIALVAGLAIGTSFRVDPGPLASQRFDEQVAPLLSEVDAWWSAGRDGHPPLVAVLGALRSGAGAPTLSHLDAALDAHDTLLVRIVGVDLPTEARGAQRQAVVAVTLSRDAIEVLARATLVPPGAARTELIAEVTRLRIRSEQIMSSTTATVEELSGSRRRLSSLPALPGFLELRP
jgi:hypothetical protein